MIDLTLPFQIAIGFLVGFPSVGVNYCQFPQIEDPALHAQCRKYNTPEPPRHRRDY